MWILVFGGSVDPKYSRHNGARRLDTGNCWTTGAAVSGKSNYLRPFSTMIYCQLPPSTDPGAYMHDEAVDASASQAFFQETDWSRVPPAMSASNPNSDASVMSDCYHENAQKHAKAVQLGEPSEYPWSNHAFAGEVMNDKGGCWKVSANPDRLPSKCWPKVVPSDASGDFTINNYFAEIGGALQSNLLKPGDVFNFWANHNWSSTDGNPYAAGMISLNLWSRGCPKPGSKGACPTSSSSPSKCPLTAQGFCHCPTPAEQNRLCNPYAPFVTGTQGLEIVSLVKTLCVDTSAHPRGNRMVGIWSGNGITAAVKNSPFSTKGQRAIDKTKKVNGNTMHTVEWQLIKGMNACARKPTS
jgi:hypothetical protein